MVDLPQATSVFALDGGELTTIRRTTCLVSLIVSGNHQETIFLFIFQSPFTPVVLGHPWLVLHNPQIDWVKGGIHLWKLSCHSNCLVSAVSPVTSVSVFQEEPGDLSGVPEEYHDLRSVFSRSRAVSLQPIHSYDCAIDLHPNTTPPAVDFIPSLRPNERLWRNISRSLLTQGLLSHLRHPPALVSFLSRRRMGLCVRVSIIEG